MVYLDDYPEAGRAHVLDQDLMTFDETPWVEGPPLASRRVALVSTAGLHRKDDRPFGVLSSEYRIIPGDTDVRDLVMSHVSTNFDRTGFMRDVNVAFPLDRLRELAADGTIGEVAAFHYSFMGATPPDRLEATARQVAGLLKEDNVNAVVLVPV